METACIRQIILRSWPWNGGRCRGSVKEFNCKVPSTTPSYSEAHAGFFRMSINGNLMFIYCDFLEKKGFPHKLALILYDFTVHETSVSALPVLSSRRVN